MTGVNYIAILASRVLGSWSLGRLRGTQIPSLQIVTQGLFFLPYHTLVV
jgi:hypothetical protein